MPTIAVGIEAPPVELPLLLSLPLAFKSPELLSVVSLPDPVDVLVIDGVLLVVARVELPEVLMTTVGAPETDEAVVVELESTAGMR